MARLLKGIRNKRIPIMFTGIYPVSYIAAMFTQQICCNACCKNVVIIYRVFHKSKQTHVNLALACGILLLAANGKLFKINFLELVNYPNIYQVSFFTFKYIQKGF